ncbi:probable glycosyl transferase [Aromatoleum aromaticum EbN1]|uniref:Probable glycosyl transferase n=1 Tax=Aromatoleum aromaticum (strain DSM 19018 / LMG 30748 / EbN1) TaxID=76114 RepID=Q5P6S2_AROAE|nr:glycosyltransferase [Aromatoleum aromaticum]CAI06989.1 probable glycosyl transferase [Aromatoleum aromaticum EbN1]
MNDKHVGPDAGSEIQRGGSAGAGADLIDVIVPVFRGAEETRRCLESVLGCSARARFELIVVDDCSPEPEVVALVDALAATGRIHLLRNESNRGFVGSVNRAMALHPERDVVLLNSDTEVANDWLDRLRGAAYSATDIGTVTPFSNNGTICSYPFEDWGGEVPGTLGLAALDRLVADALAGEHPELPTGVGFCLYIRRACLDAVGLFDEARFGRGYGEESDFCMRAQALGWRSVLAADVFVLHAGSVSFGDERIERVREAEPVIAVLHPDYARNVAAFLLADPLRFLRQRIGLKRAMQGPAEALAVVEEVFAEREAKSAEPRRLADALRDDGNALRRLLDEARAYQGVLEHELERASGFVREREADVTTLQAENKALAAGNEALRQAMTHANARLEVITSSRIWRYARFVLKLMGRK